MKTKNKRLSYILGSITLLLLLPLIAMQFSEEVLWSSSDFIIMGILLLGTGLLCELVLRKVTGTRKRVVLCLMILLVFLLVWAELAVGIFDTPFAGS